MSSDLEQTTSGPAAPQDGAPPPPRRRRTWRRVLVTAAVVVALPIAAGLYGYRVWLPGHRPALGAGETHGVDVSHHQRGGIDWQRVAADGIGFAYLKATEGGDHVDRDFHRNWDGAAHAGLRRGAYHFFTLCTPGDVQAANFLATVPDDPGALAPAVDLELAGNCSRRPPQSQVHRELRAFLDAVEAATGERAVLYFGSPWDGFERRYRIRQAFDRPLWQRSIALRPRGDWQLWQVSGVADVDGINGPVDLNVGRLPAR